MAVQSHPPPAASVHVAEANPMPARGPPIRVQEVVVPDSIKQPAGKPSLSVPVVFVASVYVPFALAVHVPVTDKEPERVTLSQVRGSSPAREMSRSELLNVRQDDVTFQVPTTLPPQAVPFGQDPPDPPAVPVLPATPVPAGPPPPVPDGPEFAELQAPEMLPNATAITRAADCSFIDLSPFGTTRIRPKPLQGLTEGRRCCHANRREVRAPNDRASPARSHLAPHAEFGDKTEAEKAITRASFARHP